MVYQNLRTAILRGELRPHIRIVERDIAQQLGVSRSPVREALQRLERDGLVRAVPGRQRSLLEVAPVNARELRQTSAATAALEAIGAEEAASRPRHERLDLARELGHLLDEASTEMARHEGSFARALEFDERFHRQLADEFLEPSLRMSLDAIRTHIYRYTWIFSPRTGVSAQQFRKEHMPIVAALRNGDTRGIRNALALNWSGFADRILPLLGENE